MTKVCQFCGAESASDVSLGGWRSIEFVPIDIDATMVDQCRQIACDECVLRIRRFLVSIRTPHCTVDPAAGTIKVTDDRTPRQTGGEA